MQSVYQIRLLKPWKDQDGQIIEPDHDPNCLILFLEELFFKKGCFEKFNRRQKSMKITQTGTEERYRGLKICAVINFCWWCCCSKVH